MISAQNKGIKTLTKFYSEDCYWRIISKRGSEKLQYNRELSECLTQFQRSYLSLYYSEHFAWFPFRRITMSSIIWDKHISVLAFLRSHNTFNQPLRGFLKFINFSLYKIFFFLNICLHLNGIIINIDYVQQSRVESWI